SGARRAALLVAHPETCDSVAELLGCEGTWGAETPEPSGAALVGLHPETAAAVELLLTGG
ncbi:hypothetical protein, partial [Streptomyces sp. wa53]